MLEDREIPLNGIGVDLRIFQGNILSRAMTHTTM